MSRPLYWVFSLLYTITLILKTGICLETRHFQSARAILNSLGNRGPNDPFQEVQDFVNKVFSAVGITKVLNGDERTSRSRVEGRVRVQKPTVEDAVRFNYFAHASLCESNLEQWDCHFCKILGSHIQFVTQHVNSKFHSKSYIAVDHKRNHIVLAYRGVYNIAMTLMVLHAVLASVPGDSSSEVRIHSGYLESTLGDYDDILAHLQRLSSTHPTYKVVVTGYSIGGAQASIMVFLLKSRNALPHTRLELYNYASPRAGNKAFADFMNNLEIPTARVVNKDDFFARLFPPLMGYYHHHNELFISDNGTGGVTARFCTTEFYEDPDCAQGRGSALLIKQPLALFTDHLTYFGIDASKCLFENPLEFFLQFAWPLRQRISPRLLEQVPKFAINTNFLLDVRYLATVGIRNLYKVANELYL